MFCRQNMRWLLLFVLASLTWANAQSEVPEEIFHRTIVIRSGNEQATAFKFNQDGRIYLVTTRRLGKNLPLSDDVVQVWHDQTWNKLQTVRTLFPASADVDLAILETGERIANPYAVVKSAEVLTTGQQVWLLGGSFGPIPLPADAPRKSWPGFEMPNIEIGRISVIDSTRPDAFEIHFQGSYDPLMAGGPIVYWSPDHSDFEILGVIKRNQTDVVTVPHWKPAQGVVIKGYGIDEVVKAIAQNPHSYSALPSLLKPGVNAF